MNNKSILLATMAFLAVSSFLMIGGIGIQTAEAGPGPGCNHKGGTSATLTQMHQMLLILTHQLPHNQRFNQITLPSTLFF